MQRQSLWLGKIPGSTSGVLRDMGLDGNLPAFNSLALEKHDIQVSASCSDSTLCWLLCSISLEMEFQEGDWISTSAT